MSEIRMVACDACGAAAPAHYVHILPGGSWIALSFGGDHRLGERRFVGQDVCSLECLLVVASRLTGFAMPPNVDKRTRTRKVTPPT